MSFQSREDQVLRSNTDPVSCTITEVTSQGMAEIGYAHFKKALFPVSTIVIYCYNSRYYYPLIWEFRLIDNNILYITEELEINSMSEVFRILTSSMDKEEKWSNEFELAVVHVKQEPKFCHMLAADFILGDIKITNIYE